MHYKKISIKQNGREINLQAYPDIQMYIVILLVRLKCGTFPMW